MTADPLQPPEHIGQMASKDTAIRMELVYHHIPKILEQLRPTRVMRKDPGMQHLWVTEDHMCTTPDRATGILWRVAVVGKCADLFSMRSQSFSQRVQLGQLVLRGVPLSETDTVLGSSARSGWC